MFSRVQRWTQENNIIGLTDCPATRALTVGCVEFPDGPPPTLVDYEFESSLCVICGLDAPKRCGACKRAQYCSIDHQREDWKVAHKWICSGSKQRQTDPAISSAEEENRRSKGRLPQLVLEVDEEPEMTEMTAAERRLYEQYNMRPKEPGEADEFDSSVDEAIDEVGKDSAGRHDKQLVKFQLAVARAQDQVIRFCRGGAPLWLRGDMQPHQFLPGYAAAQAAANAAAAAAKAAAVRWTVELAPQDAGNADGFWQLRLRAPLHVAPKKPEVEKKLVVDPAAGVPNCERCGAKRLFEFQVQPQLLHYLSDSKAGANLDWGVVAIFTCSDSCSLDGSNNLAPTSYVEEYVWRQPAHTLKAGPDEGSSGRDDD